MKIIDVAKICHEANKAYCESLGDHSQVPWEEAAEWQKTSAASGVVMHLAKPWADACMAHETWLEDKILDGWKYGEAKDPEARTHPCMVPFAALPAEQRAKDHLFKAIVNALDPFVDDDGRPEAEPCPVPNPQSNMMPLSEVEERLNERADVAVKIAVDELSQQFAATLARCIPPAGHYISGCMLMRRD